MIENEIQLNCKCMCEYVTFIYDKYSLFSDLHHTINIRTYNANKNL